MTQTTQATAGDSPRLMSADMPVSGSVATVTARPVRRRLGVSELRVFPLALGGNVFGWTADSVTAEGILDAYAAAGGNFIDTADSYAAGRSELIVGNWMRSRRNRAEVVVATKIGKSADHPGLRASAVAGAVNASLERLRTEHIDLLYLHIDDEGVPFEETLMAVDDLIRAGKVRHFGVSDHSANRLVEARVIAAQLEVAPLVAVQSHYNLMHRARFEVDLARVAGQQQLGVMPRFALAGGFLTGKYRSKADLVRTVRGADTVRYLNKRGLRVLAALDAVAEELERTADHQVSVASVAIAWLLSKPNVVAPVASARRMEQVPDLLAGTRIQLGRHQVAALDRASTP